MVYESAPEAPLAIGDKVRHARDIEKGWNYYGVGTVEGQDKFGDWIVHFPQHPYGERSFARHWIQKVEG